MHQQGSVMTSLRGQEPPACATGGDRSLRPDGARQTVWTRNMKVGSYLLVGDSKHAVSDLYQQPTLSEIHSLDNRRRAVVQSEDLCTCRRSICIAAKTCESGSRY